MHSGKITRLQNPSSYIFIFQYSSYQSCSCQVSTFGLITTGIEEIMLCYNIKPHGINQGFIKNNQLAITMYIFHTTQIH